MEKFSITKGSCLSPAGSVSGRMDVPTWNGHSTDAVCFHPVYSLQMVLSQPLPRGWSSRALKYGIYLK